MIREIGAALAVVVAAAAGVYARSDQDATPSKPPLKLWMSANASPALKTANFEKLAKVFQTVPSFAPEDSRFASWGIIAASGEDAAARHDMEGVRRACKSCHETHRKAYRDVQRGR